MCTVSWLHHDGGYDLFCNRDEQRTRSAALAPRLHTQRGVRFIAPIDGDFSGTWVGVNEFGLSLCLLNRYQDAVSTSHEAPTSRGLLLMELLDAASREDVLAHLRAMGLSRFRPFTLLALEIARPAMIARWDGRALAMDSNGDAAMPLTSSSFDTARVIASRTAYFKRLAAASGRVDAAVLEQFHASHFPTAGAQSVCLHRADAQTASFSHIRVTPGQIDFTSHAAAPCEAADRTHLLLPLIGRRRRAAWRQ